MTFGHNTQSRTHADALCHKMVAFLPWARVVSLLNVTCGRSTQSLVPPFHPGSESRNQLSRRAANFSACDQVRERAFMAWYAYCLTEQQTLTNGVRTRRPFLLEGIQGVNGAPVLSYPSGEFGVVVSEYDH